MATSVPVTSVPTNKVKEYREFWKGKKSRHAVFTINNYTPQVVDVLRSYSKKCKYLVYGFEIAPTTNTPHLQAFVCWDNPHSILSFHDTIWEASLFHIETTLKGSHQQAAEYCKKPETKDPAYPPPGYEEYGTCPRQGERTDWASAVSEIISGTPVEEVVVLQPQLLPCIRALDTFKGKCLKPLHRPVEVIVLWGDAGSGKSRFAYENYPSLYSKSPNKWWDGYTGQTTVLLDDFYGYIPYTELLNVLDRYPYHAEIKCGHVWAQWTTVIITSNRPPSQWYSVGLTPALKRRINKIFFYSIDAPPIQTYPSSSPDETETLC